MAKATSGAIGAFAATGLLYILPGGPAAVNNALETSKISADPGLDVLEALEDCISALTQLCELTSGAPDK